MHLSYDVMHILPDGIVTALVVAEDVDKEGEGIILERSLELGVEECIDDVDDLLADATPALRRTSDWTYDDKGPAKFHWATAVTGTEGSE